MSTNEKYVLFKAMGQLLACPLTSIDEVVDPVRVTKLPNTVEWFLGIASRKGNLLPVSDLGAYVFNKAESNKPSKTFSSAKWLLLTSQNETIAVTVEDVIGLAEADDIPTERSQGKSTDVIDGLTDLVKGQISVSGESAYLVDLTQLLQHEQFTSIGEPQ